MKTQLDFIRYARSGIIKQMEDLSLGQINHIPEGFSNNLVWHLGHLIAVLQVYCYGNSGVAPTVEQSLIEQYKNGTKPEGAVSEEELITLKNLAVSTIDQLEKDLQAGLFANFEPKTLGSGIVVASIDDAVEMMLFHESMHLGEVKMLKRAVLQS